MERRDVVVHTLGPAGTNCEAAARQWLRDNAAGNGTVVLHPTLEDAVPVVLEEPARNVLLGCVVYPRLHELVFQNLSSMALRECFMMPTHHMVLAAPARGPIETVLSHPAPVDLVSGRGYRVQLATSNAAAAADCAKGVTDACITTRPAADSNNLIVLEDFGPVDMGFSIHVPHQSEVYPT